jgi:hypothetical protein
MNNVYYITKIASSSSSSEIIPARTFKGDITIQLDLSNIIETEIKLIKVQIDFNDGTTLEKVYSDKVDLFETITHTYTPSNTSYIISRRCNVNLVFSNFTIHNVIIPINIAQNSFLSEYGSLTVKNAQFLDNTNVGDMFLILESEKHNLYNVCMRVGSFTSATSSVSAEEKIIITDDEEPIVTNFEDNIGVS